MDDITPAPSGDEDGAAALPQPYRRDGWTPFARRLFLQVLAETGRVSRACEYSRLSSQSAYALRNRDPMFAAGWDAACALARDPLADALREQAVDGLTETIRRDGQIVAERHRHDTRLSIAVLHRLDKRCDRAELLGSRHLPLLANWEQWLDHIGNGDDDAARALFDAGSPATAPDHQLHQLPLGDNPTDDAGCEDQLEHFWVDPDDRWSTNYPPPGDFEGNQIGTWPGPGYSRDCTPAETRLLVGIGEVDKATALAKAAAERDRCLAELRDELAALDASPKSA